MLSDYGKGGLAHIAEMIERARAAGKPVLVDPKGDDFARTAAPRCSRRTVANSAQVVGRWKTRRAELTASAQTLRAELGLDALLVTRSEEGMTPVHATRARCTCRRTRARCSTSPAPATPSSRRWPPCSAPARRCPKRVAIANRAGGIVVGKLGTAIVTRDELFPQRRKDDGHA